MWRILLGLSLLVGLLPEATSAQQWTGTATLRVTAGRQTNAYLDPVLRSWDPLSDPAFAAVTPKINLVRDARRSRLLVAAKTRLYPRRTRAPQFAQGYARYRYQLSPSWTIGLLGGGTRYRFVSSHDSWWVLPAVEWSASSGGSLTLRGGVSRRYAAPARSVTDRQTSAVVALNGDTWLSDRFRIAGRLYWSNGTTSASDMQFGGTGASVRGTYWPTNKWSVEAEAAVEQVRYRSGASSTAHDRIGRAGLKIRWHLQPPVTLFAQTQASASRLAGTEGVDTDMYVSVGLRLQTSRVLGGRPPSPPPRRHVCTPVEEGIRVQIPYDGAGTPHVTGDFNGWSLPGIPLTRSNDGTWTTTLSVESGEYMYRIRIVDGGNARWLNLPSYAQTADDAFGGTNGVCTAR
ncbi:MAG: glycogen-binding domain-containing protein [Salinibacter sp.]